MVICANAPRQWAPQQLTKHISVQIRVGQLYHWKNFPKEVQKTIKALFSFFPTPLQEVALPLYLPSCQHFDLDTLQFQNSSVIGSATLYHSNVFLLLAIFTNCWLSQGRNTAHGLFVWSDVTINPIGFIAFWLALSVLTWCPHLFHTRRPKFQVSNQSIIETGRAKTKFTRPDSSIDEETLSENNIIRVLFEFERLDTRDPQLSFQPMPLDEFKSNPLSSGFRDNTSPFPVHISSVLDYHMPEAQERNLHASRCSSRWAHGSRYSNVPTPPWGMIRMRGLQYINAGGKFKGRLRQTQHPILPPNMRSPIWLFWPA